MKKKFYYRLPFNGINKRKCEAAQKLKLKSVESTSSDYNKWSIELNYGVNKPSNHLQRYFIDKFQFLQRRFRRSLHVQQQIWYQSRCRII
jgi:ribosomal protein S4